MLINKEKFRRIIKISTAVMGVAFVGMSILSKKKKSSYVYENEPEQKNVLHGKRVVFVESQDDKENADGLKGHLEAIGDIEYHSGLYDKYVKRAIDVTLSFCGLVILSPLYLIICIAIKVDDPGPVLFTQKRVGQNKEYFKLHKFRSMKMSTPHDVPTHMLENPDQYITKVGRFLRAHSLDELPQIWDIFVGNMSIVGPRPGLWNQDVLIAERDKYGANDVRPGLTGWAQINGRDELEIPAKAKLDGEYVQKESFLFDVKCFLGTIRKVGHDDSVVEGGTGEMKKAGRHYTDETTDSFLIGQIGFSSEVTVNTTDIKRILITGAGSYIGESFCVYAREHYEDSFIIDTVNMLDPAWRNTNFSEYDIVYHVAGIAHADVGNVSEEIKEKYYAVNTDLAIEVCKIAKAAGVKEYIFMSSMIVYGESAEYGKKKVIERDTVPDPANFYGDSKLQADVAVRQLADEKFTVVVLRPPMIYGKGSKGNYPILAKIAKKLPIFPNVDNERSMLHIDNFCEFLCQLMLVEIADQSVVLMPQNSEWSETAEMVQEIGRVTGNKVRKVKILDPFVWIGSKMPGKIGGLVNKAFGNMVYDHKLSQYTGMEYQKVSLEESIRRTESSCQRKTLMNGIHKVCIVNCFDTYEHRVELLYNYFKSSGMDVQIYTSDYSHFEKCKRIEDKENFKFFEAIPYYRNMSIDRLRSHMVLARDIFREVERQKFDLLWVLIPPNSFVKEAAKYKKSHEDVKLIFDLIDLWPETMPVSKFKSLPPFQYWKNLRDKNLYVADRIVTECDLYLEKLPENVDRSKVHRLYLAREIKEYFPHIELPDDTVSLCYLGSINNIIDIPVIADLIMDVKHFKPVQVHIIGDGEKREELISACEKAGAEVIYHGKIYDSMTKLQIMNVCHYGLNIMKKSVYVGLTMKSMDYFEAGLPIINNIHGDTWNIIEQEKVGFNINEQTNYKEIVDYDVKMRREVREYFEKHFGIESFNLKVERILQE